MNYDAFVLHLLDSDNEWRDIDVSFSDDALREVARDVCSNDPEKYPSGAYRLEKVIFWSIEAAEIEEATL